MTKTLFNQRKQDKMAPATIYQGIPEDMLLSLAEKKIAKQDWEAIKTVCLGADKVKKARAQTLKCEFEIMNMKETESLDEFYMKLNGLVTNIQALGEKVEETYVVKKLLRLVLTKFLQIASAIEQFGNLEEMSVEEVIGSLKAHEERLRGPAEVNEGKLLLTEEDWKKRENIEGKLLLTRDEWLKKSSKVGYKGSGSGDNRGKDIYRGVRDRSRVRCFNCSAYGHFATECCKSLREREQKPEVNFTQSAEDEPALLFLEHEVEENKVMLVNEDKGKKVGGATRDCKEEIHVWYLDNGANSHMTGARSKFR